jgi:DNA helicase II / ATP-dependent DNA helicase PcrA
VSEPSAEPVPRHLERLNPAQYEAVTTVSGPLLILAGAGSGKTRVLTRRIAHLLHTGVEPEAIFAVTFTNKAAAEMKERVAELVGEKGLQVWVSTFHSACGRILRKDIEPLGWTRRFSIYNDDDQLRIVRQLLADRGWDPKDFPPSTFLRRIDHFKNQMLRPEDVLAQRRGHAADAVLQIWMEYEENLKAADAVDFNDLIGLVVRLFDEHPDVLARYREQFQYVLVDEYQDTNHAQYRLLQLLVGEHHNLCCVGDDDQSIYGFRGADIRNILDFQRDHPEARVVRMEQNYRCSKNILSVANAVVARNTGRIEKSLWTTAEPGPRVNVLVAPTPREEARLVARAMKQLRARGHGWEDMVVLYRSNRTARVFEQALSQAGIPCEVVGAQSFYQRREVRDLVAYLRLVVNPADDAAFLRICNVPARGIGTATLNTIREDAATRGEPLLTTARALAAGSGRTARVLAPFVTLIDSLAALARDLPAAPLVREVLERSGYQEMLQQEDTAEARERLAHLDALVHRAVAADQDPGLTPPERLQGWLDTVALTARDDAEESEASSRVTLMTVHTSKGLEFPVVFVVHLMEGTFPHERSLESASGLEEERRLAYVAFTRAQERLVVTRSRQRPGRDPRKGGETAVPSRFLYGLPEAVCAGDLPTVFGDGLVDEDADPERRDQALRRFLAARHRAPERAPVLPDGIVTGPVEDLSQLAPGARVVHPRFGLGEVRLAPSGGARPSVRVTFEDRRTRRIPLHPCPLERVLREPDPDEAAVPPGQSSLREGSRSVDGG